MSAIPSRHPLHLCASFPVSIAFLQSQTTPWVISNEMPNIKKKSVNERVSSIHSVDLLSTIYEVDKEWSVTHFLALYVFFMWELDEMRYNQHHQHLIPSVSVYVYGSLTKIFKRKNEKKPIRRTCAHIFVIVSATTIHCECALERKVAWWWEYA